jgi:hypothetical protein
MLAYTPVISNKQIQSLQMNKANSTGRSFSLLDLPLSAEELDLLLSAEEKEQQLNTFDNRVKTIDVLNQIEDFPSSEQIGVTSGWEERDRFTEELYNTTLDEFEKMNPLQNSVNFVSNLDIITAEAPESTPANPIMYVASGFFQNDMVLTWYKVYVNQVNPHSATREEMFALITYEYRDSSAEDLLKATNAWCGTDPCTLNNGDNGRIDFMKVLKSCFELASKDYKNNDMRIKDSYEGLMDMIDKLGKREK